MAELDVLLHESDDYQCCKASSSRFKSLELVSAGRLNLSDLMAVSVSMPMDVSTWEGLPAVEEQPLAGDAIIPLSSRCWSRISANSPGILAHVIPGARASDTPWISPFIERIFSSSRE